MNDDVPMAPQPAQDSDSMVDRNLLILLLASLYPSGRVARESEAGCGGTVFVDLPTGQVSWDYDAAGHREFAHLDPYVQAHDGHTADDTRERMRMLARQLIAARAAAP